MQKYLQELKKRLNFASDSKEALSFFITDLGD
jgi:hypothetical protein